MSFNNFIITQDMKIPSYGTYTKRKIAKIYRDGITTKNVIKVLSIFKFSVYIA